LLQVQGGSSPEWAPFDWGQHSGVGSAALNGLCSGQLHIHLYTDSATNHDDASPLADSGPQHPLLEADALLAEARRLSGGHHSTSNGRSSAAAGIEHQQQQQGQQGGLAEARSGPGTGPPIAEPLQPDVRWPPACAQGMPQAACPHVRLPGRLVAALSVDLDALEPLRALADLDARVLPRNTLIFELSDGLYVWPPSRHLPRTASGAVPSSVVAPKPARGGPGPAQLHGKQALPEV
jgi:hypothetical protein